MIISGHLQASPADLHILTCASSEALLLLWLYFMASFMDFSSV
jgi:hypothetical protein